MIDPEGLVYETQDQPRGGKVSQVDFSAGIIGFSKKVYFGFAAHHLNEPNESLVVGVSRLPMKLTAHFGALLPLDGDSKYASAFISPNILYRRQGEFQQMNFGAYVSKGPIVGGIWYRASSAPNIATRSSLRWAYSLMSSSSVTATTSRCPT